MKRLINQSNIKTKNDHQFELEKAIQDFKKKYNVTKEDLKDKTTKNPLYQLWKEYMFENYPIWSMSSVAYVLKGWGYLVGVNYPYYLITEKEDNIGDLGESEN